MSEQEHKMSGEPFIVQKYGGSSLATVENLRRIAKKVAETRRQGFSVVVVVSAMGSSTDDLMGLAGELSKDPGRRELDLLLGTGEHVSAALLALALQAQEVEAIALTGPQSGIITNSVHTNARILEINSGRVRSELMAGRVVVVAGFQGVSRLGELTTLGRGGSDTSAVAMAAALGAERCEIFTDVDGVFSADPNRVPDAQLIEELPHGTMQELAWHGARVLKAEAVEFARDNNIDVTVRNSFGGAASTVVRALEEGAASTWVPEVTEVAGVAGRQDLVRIRVGSHGQETTGLETTGPEKADPEKTRLRELVGMVSKYDLVSGRFPGPEASCELYLATEEIPELAAFSAELRLRIGDSLEVSELLGAVSLVGFGLGSRPRALLDAALILERSGIEVSDSWTSRESVSFVVPVDAVDRGALVLHRSFVANGEARQWGSISA